MDNKYSCSHCGRLDMTTAWVCEYLLKARAPLVTHRHASLLCSLLIGPLPPVLGLVHDSRHVLRLVPVRSANHLRKSRPKTLTMQWPHPLHKLSALHRHSSPQERTAALMLRELRWQYRWFRMTCCGRGREAVASMAGGTFSSVSCRWGGIAGGSFAKSSATCRGLL